MNTLWIFSIEPIESRYTCQWYLHVPSLLKGALQGKLNVSQINGDTMPGKLIEGEFLDFASTNQWKNEQASKFLEMCKDGRVQKNDQVIFMDAWNPVIPELKYVSELKKLNLKMHGLWHAGSWDKWDFLGRLIGDAQWIRSLERSMYACLDHNYFATEFHVRMHNAAFPDYNASADMWNKKIVLTGWPFEFLDKQINAGDRFVKQDMILFPHRLAPEKQLAIFEDLKQSMPQYNWVVCQAQPLTKDGYHNLLKAAKMVFSASLQETLGISVCLEGPLAGAIPLAPHRLSYKEIFGEYPEFEYPSEWTEDMASYLKNKDLLMKRIEGIMENYDEYVPILNRYTNRTLPEYGTFRNGIEQIIKCCN
jgi:hypothetical protein